MLSSRFESWLHERQTKLNDRRIRKLQRQSTNSNGKGWFFDAKDPSLLFVLGYSLNLDKPWTPGFSLTFFEGQYRKLKQRVAREHNGFKPKNVVLEIEASYAASLLQDRQLLSSLQPELLEFRDLRTNRVTSTEIKNLVVTLNLDGDPVVFRITSNSHSADGMFIYHDPTHSALQKRGVTLLHVSNAD